MVPEYESSLSKRAVDSIAVTRLNSTAIQLPAVCLALCGICLGMMTLIHLENHGLGASRNRKTLAGPDQMATMFKDNGGAGDIRDLTHNRIRGLGVAAPLEEITIEDHDLNTLQPRRAYEDYHEAYENYNEAYEDSSEGYKDYCKAYEDHHKAYKDHHKAYEDHCGAY
ncbi:hypothetical protein BDZ89DRAFT_1039021 [Hymenopellis radicata]|nr:hypothetical protein BDZ89DRAFT_1039021 [Hymenopellis radicata]